MSRLLALPAAGLAHSMALPLRPGRRAVHRLVERVREWPVESQQAARRNAMVACTALAARRAEREDVEDFLRGLVGARVAAAHG